jgi:hypothetical protein
MSTGTQTATFTLAHIRRVINNFGADCFMIGQSTGLATQPEIEGTVTDLIMFANEGFLVEIAIILWNSAGTDIRGRRYTVSTAATGWKSDEPGDNNWPRTPGGRLQIIATMSDAWWRLSNQGRQSVIERLNIQGKWPVTSTDTSFKDMTGSQDRQFASGGFGIQRWTYQRK